MSTQINN